MSHESAVCARCHMDGFCNVSLVIYCLLPDHLLRLACVCACPRFQA